MHGLLQMFPEGGAPMYAVLGLGLAAIPAALVVALLIGGLRWRAPATLAWLGLSGCLLAGYGGALYGTHQASEALAYASPDTVELLGAVGSAYARYPIVLAALLGAFGLALVAWAAALPAAIAPGPSPRLDKAGLGGAVGGAALGLVVAVLVAALAAGQGALRAGPLALLAPAVALSGALACVVASARVASEDPQHQGRIAGTRGFVMVSAALAVVLLGEATRHAALSTALGAMANAPAESRSVFLAMGLGQAAAASRLAWGFAAMPLLAGLFGLFPIFGRADGRVAVGAALGALQLAAVLGVALWAASALGALTPTLGG